MNLLRNLSVRTKLAVAVLLCVGGIATFVVMVFQGMKPHLEDSDYAPLVEAKDLLADVLPPPLAVLEVHDQVLSLAREKDPAAQAEIIKHFGQLKQDFDAREAFWKTHLAEGEVKVSLIHDAAAPVHDLFEVIDHDLIPAVRAHDAAAVDALINGKIADAYRRHRRAIDETVKGANQLAEARTRDAAASINARKMRFAMVGVVLMLVVLGFGLLIATTVTRGISRTIEALNAVANGDLSRQVEVEADDEFGRMAATLNETVISLRQVFGEVRGLANNLTGAAQQLASSADTIASGAQEQAASLEETAASMEEITATVKQSSENASQASQLAVRSRQIAEKGGEVVASAVSAMDAINDSSKRIAAIITTIDEIAFQTNLLALNAAVEAARAGEQGRGFAVVATEVRSLAQRSANAAREIKDLIRDSVDKVNAGARMVSQSGETLGEIVTSVKQVTDIVGEMASAFREQSTGLEQVNESVAQMDTVTQSNSSQTESLSGTAARLAAQAEQLRGAMARFKLAADGYEATPADLAEPAAPELTPAQPVPAVSRASRGARRPATSGFKAEPEDAFAAAAIAAQSAASNGVNGVNGVNGHHGFEEI